MYARTPPVLSICLSMLLVVSNMAAMMLTESKKPASTEVIAKPNAIEDQKASTASGKDAKEAVAQIKTPVLVRQMGERILFTAPQPTKKMCAKNETLPSPEQLNDPDIRRWYEIDDGENEAPHNEVLRNLVTVVKDHFIHNVFPYYKNILITFDIDETAVTYFEYYYKFYKTPPLNQLEIILNVTRDCGANQPILDLYNFFKTNGCTVVFISSRQPSIDIQDLGITIQLEQLTWKGLRGAGYDVKEKDIYLCSDHALKQRVRLGLTRQAYTQGKRFDYVAAFDDDLYVICTGDDLDCCVWVPSAYSVDREAEHYYKELEALPDPSAPSEGAEDNALMPLFQLRTSPNTNEAASDVCIIVGDPPIDDVDVDVSIRYAAEFTDEFLQHAKAKDNAANAEGSAHPPATTTLGNLINPAQSPPSHPVHNPDMQ